MPLTIRRKRRSSRTPICLPKRRSLNGPRPPVVDRGRGRYGAGRRRNNDGRGLFCSFLFLIPHILHAVCFFCIFLLPALHCPCRFFYFHLFLFCLSPSVGCSCVQQGAWRFIPHLMGERVLSSADIRPSWIFGSSGDLQSATEEQHCYIRVDRWT